MELRKKNKTIPSRRQGKMTIVEVYVCHWQMGEKVELMQNSFLLVSEGNLLLVSSSSVPKPDQG